MTDNDKITKIVKVVLAQKKEPPKWNASRLELILKQLPEEYSEKLAEMVVRRALHFKQEYGVWNDEHFEVLRDFFYVREEDLSKSWQKKNVEGYGRKVFGALTDTCAVMSLMPTGQRVGNHWVNLYEMTVKARERKSVPS